MDKLCNSLEYIEAYIDDLFIISNCDFEDHLNKVKIVLNKLKVVGFKINTAKSFFASDNLEYLGFHINILDIIQFPDKVQAIKHNTIPINKKRLKSFLGVINYYIYRYGNIDQISRPG